MGFKKYLSENTYKFKNFELKTAADLIRSEFDYARQKITNGENSLAILDKLENMVTAHLQEADYNSN